jgi:hypothetical protein
MTTPEKEAFEAAYPHYDQRLGADGKYHSRVSQGAYTYFTKGVAYGRKQALEDAAAICKKFLTAGATDNNDEFYMDGVGDCSDAIKELIK